MKPGWTALLALLAAGCGSSMTPPDDEAGDADLDTIEATDGDRDPGETRDDAGPGADGDAPEPEADTPPACEPDLPCDDGNACTLDTICGPDGTCGGGTPRTCDDGNLCTDNLCDPVRACIFPANTEPCDDGDPCTDGDRCADGRCVGGTPADDWYRDGDGDGFGVDGDPVCAAEAPPGYAPEPGDCCDSNAQVNPGQAAWFGNAYRCGGFGTPESFDYNCDGSPERRWTALGVCGDDGSGGCDFAEGWQGGGSIPRCGTGAMYVTACRRMGFSCQPTAGWRTQECR